MNRLVIVGAGPVGLHAALRGTENRFDVTVLERGDIGAAVRQWAHVKLFTPFFMNSTVAARASAAAGARLPDNDALLTGEQYIRRYLNPLANSSPLRGRIQTFSELLAVSRQAYRKTHMVGKPERAESPFRLLVRRADDSESVIESDVLLDCTGFTTQHRFIGIGGIPCPGECSCLTTADYRIAARPLLHDPAGHVVVIGSGYSAATSVCVLQKSGQPITWVTLGPRDVPISAVTDDSLPERRTLTEQANKLALDPDSTVHWMPGARIESIERNQTEYQLNLSFVDGGRKTIYCDRVVANPGFRPDSRPFEELQIHRCYATGAPIKLAAHLLGKTTGDCLTQTSAEATLLCNPEPNFFILGAASYGRDSRFLLRNGLEQVEQLFDTILCPMKAVT